jgi:rhomboid protease GluP
MPEIKRQGILCPNCRKLISAQEPTCPYCGISSPGSWWRNNLLIRAVHDGDRLIRAVLYANIAMFAISLLFNARMPGFSMNPFHALSPENRSLLDLGATGVIPIGRYHRYWTIVSASYLHAGIVHLLFNMIAFKQLAPLVTREYGPFRMFAIYTLGGAFGFWISYRAGVIFTIGASASVCALIGGILYYGFSRGGTYGRAIYMQIGGWALGLFLFGLLVPGINNWGHGGGLFGGAAIGYFLGYQERSRERYLHQILGTGCAVVTVCILVWAIFSGIFQRLA